MAAKEFFFPGRKTENCTGKGICQRLSHYCFDEATSGCDAENEFYINKAIAEISRIKP